MKGDCAEKSRLEPEKSSREIEKIHREVGKSLCEVEVTNELGSSQRRAKGRDGSVSFCAIKTAISVTLLSEMKKFRAKPRDSAYILDFFEETN